MALVSPGIEVTVSDESQYLPSAAATVPLVVIATAQDKLINGLVAAGTTKANAGRIYGITSQRELATTYGLPVFRRSTADTPLHGDELNEYGLMAAYSALGLGNRAWVVRADIDLDELEGTTVRPTGTVPSGTHWFNYSGSRFGIFEFDSTVDSSQVPFTAKTPVFLTSNSVIVSANGTFTVDTTVGSSGDYGVYVGQNNNFVYKKSTTGTWNQVGSGDWLVDTPIVSSTLTETGALSTAFGASSEFDVRVLKVGGTWSNVTVTVSPNSNMATIANAINTTSGLAAAEVATRENSLTGLDFLVTTANVSYVILKDGVGTPLANLGITASASTGTIYNSPTVTFASHAQNPSWRRTGTTSATAGRPSGSVWFKTSAEGSGLNFDVQRYSSTTNTWASLAAPAYSNGITAIQGIDLAGGGLNIPAGTLFVKYQVGSSVIGSFRIFRQKAKGESSAIGSAVPSAFTNGHQIEVLTNRPGTTTLFTTTVTLAGTGIDNFVSAFNGAGIPNVTASKVDGKIKITHKAGGVVAMRNVGSGTALADAKFSAPVYSATGELTSGNSSLVNDLYTGYDSVISNWESLIYYVSSSIPTAKPANGKLWYYDDPVDIDIMINTDSGWKGYRSSGLVDVRGYVLQSTSDDTVQGVIVSASRPERRSSTQALKSGDLWLDSSDLENYPRLYRYNATGNGTWNLIDNTDRTSQNGIIFADARWGTSNSIDPISDALPSTTTMLSSNHTDPDCPQSALYPRGILLFNTRRSGYNVKKFVVDYFNSVAYPNAGITTAAYRDAWVSVVGYSATNQPLMGHHAQRNEIVQAMKSAVDSNTNLREEGYAFNLIAAPGYPELIPNLVALNNDRANTGFVIADTAMTLPATTTDVVAYNSTQNTANPYLGIYYPAALTNDLAGNEIAVPATHMMLRTFMYNDNVSYPWFAPAGTRRGLIDNALAIGYVDAESGLFVRTGINNNLRDTLYEGRMNPITLINGVGIVAYGQKTRSPSIAGAGSSMDRVNVARMVVYLRTILQGVANQFLFEPNDKTTRDQVKQLVESLMNDLLAKRGIYDYLVVCDESNNTSDRIARNELYIDIAVEPMKAVEFIYIPIRLRNPGSIAGTATTA
jgi:hypothetical protein